MSQDTFERQQAQVDHADGDATISLDRSHYYERIEILLDWDITVNTTGSPSSGDGVFELLQDISVTLNGNQTVKKVDLAMSHLIDQYQYGTRPVADTIDFSTASQQTGKVSTFVDFLIVPDDQAGMIPSFETSAFDLELQWGDAADIGGDVTINSVTATVNSKERLRSSVANPNSQREEKVLNNLYVFKERQKRKVLDTAGKSEIELPKGNVYYATPFRVYDGGSPDNALVDRFELIEDGVDTHKNITYDAARAKDVTEYGFQAEDLPDGLVYPNFGLKGDLQDVVSTQDMGSWELTVDTDDTSPTDPAEVKVVTQELIQ